MASSIFRPMLGAPMEDLRALRFPLIASYKYDGFRGIWWGLEFMSRKLLTIPNRALAAKARSVLGHNFPRWDGELVVGDPFGHGVFNRAQKTLTKALAPADNIRFFVFDNIDAPGGFAQRIATLHDIGDFVIKIDQVIVDHLDDLLAMEEKAVALGYEGICARSPDSPYKYGRSTSKQQWLLKIKRFQDAEAICIGFEERMHNANEPTTNELGYTKRSHEQSGKIPAGTLGALLGKWKGLNIRVGAAMRRDLADKVWANQASYLNRPFTFKYQLVGTDQLPRIAVFKGWVESWDK